MTTSLVDRGQVSEYDQLYASGFDHMYPDLDLVRLERWYFKAVAGRVLDYGSGTGENLIHLLRRGYTVEGIDASSESCRLIEKKLGRSPEFHGRAAVRPIDPEATRLPYEDGAFDYVVCVSVLSHLVVRERIDRLLAEFRRVMKPGAKMIVSAQALGSLFSSQGRCVGDDVYELKTRRSGAESASVRFIVRSEDQMRGFFGDFTVDDLGFSAFKYMNVDEYEYIVCARKA